MNIFDIMYPKYKIKKSIRLIEAFGGYGSQHFALEYLGMKVEHWKLIEWAVKSIQAYKDGHYSNIQYNCDETVTKDVLVDYLLRMGISFDYNSPATKEEIKRRKFEELKLIALNIKMTKNLVNICNVKGKDLDIVEKDKYEYIFTYSFPCQDLSLAGKQKGMSRDSNTRSGMLWEVERILEECKEIDSLPQILLMENVPQVIGTDNVNDFNEWQLRLESLGYKNYHNTMIATDYFIPQARNRTYMVSILGDYSYTFPNAMKLRYKLKYLLENNVEEKYYLSKKVLSVLNYDMEDIKENNVGIDLNSKHSNFREIANTIKARYDCGYENFSPGPTGVVEFKSYLGTYQYAKSDNFMQGKDRFQVGKEISDTLQTTPKEGVVIKEATKKGYAIATEGDSINLEQPNSSTHRGRVGKGIAQTLMTNPQQATIQDLKIRKLTPNECFRLMGVKDEDYNNIAKNQSDSSLYHLAGDSIVTTVLMGIFGELLGIDYITKIQELLENLKGSE